MNKNKTVWVLSMTECKETYVRGIYSSKRAALKSMLAFKRSITTTILNDRLLLGKKLVGVLYRTYLTGIKFNITETKVLDE